MKEIKKFAFHNSICLLYCCKAMKVSVELKSIVTLAEGILFPSGLRFAPAEHDSSTLCRWFHLQFAFTAERQGDIPRGNVLRRVVEC